MAKEETHTKDNYRPNHSAQFK